MSEEKSKSVIDAASVAAAPAAGKPKRYRVVIEADAVVWAEFYVYADTPDAAVEKAMASLRRETGWILEQDDVAYNKRIVTVEEVLPAADTAVGRRGSNT